MCFTLEISYILCGKQAANFNPLICKAKYEKHFYFWDIIKKVSLHGNANVSTAWLHPGFLIKNCFWGSVRLFDANAFFISFYQIELFFRWCFIFES